MSFAKDSGETRPGGEEGAPEEKRAEGAGPPERLSPPERPPPLSSPRVAGMTQWQVRALVAAVLTGLLFAFAKVAQMLSAAF